MSNIAVQPVNPASRRCRDFTAAWAIDFSFQLGALVIVDTLEPAAGNPMTAAHFAGVRLKIEAIMGADWSGFEDFCLFELGRKPEVLLREHYPPALEYVPQLQKMKTDPAHVQAAREALTACWRGDEEEN